MQTFFTETFHSVYSETFQLFVQYHSITEIHHTLFIKLYF